MLKAEFDKLIEKYLEEKTSKEEEKKILDELLKFYNKILGIIHINKINKIEKRYEENEGNYKFFVEV